jgi:hypothetical protein
VVHIFEAIVWSQTVVHIFAAIVWSQIVVHIFAAIVWSQPVVHIMLLPMINILYFYIISFQSMCAVPNMALLLFPNVMLSRRCSGIYQIIVRWFQLPLINGTNFVSTFHMQCIPTIWIYIAKSSQILS